MWLWRRQLHAPKLLATSERNNRLFWLFSPLELPRASDEQLRPVTVFDVFQVSTGFLTDAAAVYQVQGGQRALEPHQPADDAVGTKIVMRPVVTNAASCPRLAARGSGAALALGSRRRRALQACR